MQVQVVQPFAPSVTERYNIGDKLDVDEVTARKLIKSGRVVEGTITPYENRVDLIPSKTPEGNTIKEVIKAVIQPKVRHGRRR